MTVQLLDIADPRYAALVDSHPEATAFHRPGWARLLADCYGFHAFLVADLDGKELTAAVPVIEVRGLRRTRRWIALPFSDYLEPLAAGDESARAFVGALDVARREAGVSRLEVRWPLDAVTGAGLPHILHLLDLDPDPDKVFAGLGRKHRQYVRKAEKEGLALLPETENDMDAFYLLHLKTHAKLGAPVQPRRFFRLVEERLLRSGAGRLFVVGDAGGPVAAAIVLHQGGNAMIKYSASDPARLSTRCHYLIFWTAIEWACRNGMRRIDFGRTEADAAGLIQFKDGWGAVQAPFGYTYLGSQPGAASPARVAPILKPLIRHTPLWVGRGIGELLYRFSA